MLAILMTLAMAAADGPSTATESVAAPPDPPIASKEDENKIKCIRQAPTGTRFEKRICKTMYEWNRQGKQARSDLRQIQERPMIKLCPPAGCS